MHSILEFKKKCDYNRPILYRSDIEVKYYTKKKNKNKKSQMCVFRETFYVECVNIKIFTKPSNTFSLDCL